MADGVFGFDGPGIKRVIRATRKSEQELPMISGRKSNGAPSPSGWFWIMLTGEGTGGALGFYSWKLVYPEPTDTINWTDASPAVTGTLNAREAGRRRGLASFNSFYSGFNSGHFLATFIGYDSDGVDQYLFITPATETRLLELRSPLSGGGKYSATVVTSPNNGGPLLDTTTDLTLSHNSPLDTVMAINPMEMNQSTHVLRTTYPVDGHNDQVPGIWMGDVTTEDGTDVAGFGVAAGSPIFIIAGEARAVETSPITLGPTTTWDRQTDGQPVNLSVVTIATDNGDGTYSFGKRTLHIDAAGIIRSISAQS